MTIKTWHRWAATKAPLSAETPRAGKAIVAIDVYGMTLIRVARKDELVPIIYEFGAAVGVGNPAGQFVGATPWTVNSNPRPWPRNEL